MASRTTWNGDRRISSRDDVQRVLAEINADARRAGTAALARALRTAEDTVIEADASQILPAAPELVDQLLPWPGGLRRGATVAAVGSTSLIITLLAGAMAGNSSWAAIIGLPAFGVLAAAEAGVPVDRLEDGGFADSGGRATVNLRVANAMRVPGRRVRPNRGQC